jgi:hypothetical protein
MRFCRNERSSSSQCSSQQQQQQQQSSINEHQLQGGHKYAL